MLDRLEVGTWGRARREVGENALAAEAISYG